MISNWMNQNFKLLKTILSPWSVVSSMTTRHGKKTTAKPFRCWNLMLKTTNWTHCAGCKAVINGSKCFFNDLSAKQNNKSFEYFSSFWKIIINVIWKRITSIFIVSEAVQNESFTSLSFIQYLKLGFWVVYIPHSLWFHHQNAVHHLSATCNNIISLK